MDPSIPTIERPAFFEGQRLTADDLAAAQDYARELRWLHNRALHGWGIALGLGVAGARGDTAVAVASGYALDSSGRDLVLRAGRSEPVPPAASGSYALTISYADDADLEQERRAGTCGRDGAVRLLDEPRLRWLDANGRGEDRVRPGLDVVLAVVDVTGCAVERLSTKERIDLTRACPHTGTGRTSAGDTRWRLWPDAGNAVGLATTVSTADAGFTTTPAYQARLAGERIVDDSLLDGYPFVTDASANTFDLAVVLATGSNDLYSAGGLNVNAVTIDEELARRVGEELDWHVVWIGVEGR